MAQTQTIASLVANAVMAVRSGNARALGEGDPIFPGDRVVTGPRGAVIVASADGTRLGMGGKGTLEVYADLAMGTAALGAGTEQAPFSLLDGNFRIVIGAQPVSIMAGGSRFTLTRPTADGQGQRAYIVLTPACVTFIAGTAPLTVTDAAGTATEIPAGSAVCLGVSPMPMAPMTEAQRGVARELDRELVHRPDDSGFPYGGMGTGGSGHGHDSHSSSSSD
ncbi:hypothetical protein [Zavarzinia sp. CC-PAN008]|uniref:hypothetical protein n=1 Tax=Zavarzinia sp. CC-PAN008 TaxID=3243332 RepID=UPI003F745429